MNINPEIPLTTADLNLAAILTSAGLRETLDLNNQPRPGAEITPAKKLAVAEDEQILSMIRTDGTIDPNFLAVVPDNWLTLEERAQKVQKVAELEFQRPIWDAVFQEKKAARRNKQLIDVASIVLRAATPLLGLALFASIINESVQKLETNVLPTVKSELSRLIDSSADTNSILAQRKAACDQAPIDLKPRLGCSYVYDQVQNKLTRQQNQ